MKNGQQVTIPTAPVDVYATLAAMLRDGKLPLNEHGAVAFAMGAMRSAFPLSARKFDAVSAALEA